MRTVRFATSPDEVYKYTYEADIDNGVDMSLWTPGGALSYIDKMRSGDDMCVELLQCKHVTLDRCADWYAVSLHRIFYQIRYKLVTNFTLSQLGIVKLQRVEPVDEEDMFDWVVEAAAVRLFGVYFHQVRRIFSAFMCFAAPLATLTRCKDQLVVQKVKNDCFHLIILSVSHLLCTCIGVQRAAVS